jgi:peptidoglycan-N-acetylglucosamine deacetylase
MKLIVLFFSSVASYEIISKCIDVNHIAITFDDGIHANTEKILDILDYHDVSATFFVNGENIKDKKSEDVAKRIYNSNNIIATHTYSHPVVSSYRL